jgi:II/X family phage/plasmid replication protein
MTLYGMLDWFRGSVPFLHHPLPAGRVMSIEADGSVEWESVKAIPIRSSHETSIKIKSAGGNGEGMATELLIDGNLSKFLQGHNILGGLDCTTLLAKSFQQIYEQHAVHFAQSGPIDLTLARIRQGQYKIAMLDINQLFDIGNDPSVEAWLHAAHMRARSRHGRSTRDKGTVYLGQYSRRWAVKFYNKWRELHAQGKTHKLPQHLQGLGLEDFIKGKLRAELRIFSKELEKLGITHGYHITPQKLLDLFNSYLGKIEMTTQATLIDDQLLKMPRTIQASYQLWRQGADLRNLLAHNTFYTHRRKLLAYGIDINMPCMSPEHNNVVPLIRVIEATPVKNPEWAYNLNLIAA